MAKTIKRVISKNITFPKTNIRVQEDRRTHWYHLVHGILSVAKWKDGTTMNELEYLQGYEEKIHGRILDLYKKYGRHEPRKNDEPNRIELIIPEEA